MEWVGGNASRKIFWSKGRLSIIIVVKLEICFNLLFGTSLFSILLLLLYSFQDIESKISSIVDAKNIRLILHALITG